jgi:hypothetical protein
LITVNRSAVAAAIALGAWCGTALWQAAISNFDDIAGQWTGRLGIGVDDAAVLV